MTKDWRLIEQAEEILAPYTNKDGEVEFSSDAEMKEAIAKILGVNGRPAPKIFDDGTNFAFLAGPFDEDEEK